MSNKICISLMLPRDWGPSVELLEPTFGGFNVFNFVQ